MKHFGNFPGRRSLQYSGAILLLTLLACGGRTNLQLSQPQAAPAQNAICTQDTAGNLLLEISNQGKRQSIATTTAVEFPGRPPFLVPTRPIIRNQPVSLQIPVPTGCQEEPCQVRVTLDSKEESGPSRSYQFRCQLRPFQLSRSPSE